jgi:hypothetical protein
MFAVLKECVLAASVQGLPASAASPAICAEDTPKPIAIETLVPSRHGLARAAAGKAGLPPIVTESAFFPGLVA